MDAYCVHAITSKQLFTGFLQRCVLATREVSGVEVDFGVSPGAPILPLRAALLPVKPSHESFFQKMFLLCCCFMCGTWK